jgi:hypothetical protein
MGQIKKRFRVVMTYVVYVDAPDEARAADRADDFVTGGACVGECSLVDIDAETTEITPP